jgi:hypothetical protein
MEQCCDALVRSRLILRSDLAPPNVRATPRKPAPSSSTQHQHRKCLSRPILPLACRHLSQYKSELICTNPIHGEHGARGHTLQTCFSKGGGKEGQRPAHWFRKKQPTAQLAPTVSEPSANLTTKPAVTPASDYVASYSLFMATTRDPTTAVQTFLDSGASHHYFVDKSWFSEYLAITPMQGRAAQKVLVSISSESGTSTCNASSMELQNPLSYEMSYMHLTCTPT